jgi:hypothetical protein
MLQEIDELDQFRITVQQLEVCRGLILKGGEAHSRSALILLDHISEVILYRIMREEIERDEFTRKVLPQRYPPKKRSQIERVFHAKLDAVASVHHLPAVITTTLKILHGYRNAAQHQDKHNPAVLPVLARISLVATADLFARTAAGFKNRGIGGLSRPIEWLQPYGLDTGHVWYESVAKEIGRQLKRGVRPKLPLVNQSLATDISTRAEAVRNVLDEVFDGDVAAADRMLKWYEFLRARWDLESKLSEKVRALDHKIAAGRGDEVTREEYLAADQEFQTAYDKEFNEFVPRDSYKTLDRIQSQVSSLASQKNFHSALSLYRSLDQGLTSLEASTTRGYHDIESYAELMSDIERGK